MQTVLVDEQGYTLHEFHGIVSEQTVFAWVRAYEPEYCELYATHDDISVPPVTYIWRKYMPTGKVTMVGYIKERE